MADISSSPVFIMLSRWLTFLKTGGSAGASRFYGNRTGHCIRQKEAKDFFTKMATRSKGVSNVIYEIFNEPVDDSWEQVKAYFENQEDMQNSPKPKKYPVDGVCNRSQTAWGGDAKYKDLSGPDGKPAGVINEYDKTNIGSPIPDFTFGWTNTFRYKDFDLSVFINGSYGNKVYNYLKIISMSAAWSN